MTPKQAKALKSAEEWAKRSRPPSPTSFRLRPPAAEYQAPPPAHPDYQEWFAGAPCTLDGRPAKIIGRTWSMAYVEAVDGEIDPIRLTWDAVEDVLLNCDAAFSTEADADEEPA